MSDRRHSKDDALDKIQFLSLYTAALRLNGWKRDAALLAVLCAGRLKMRIGEIMHLHEGWIDWSHGYIRIPEFEPCGCKYCWKRARRNFDEDKANEDGYPDNYIEYHYNNRWSPKTPRGSRPVPFNWSHRITAVLVYFFTENEVIDEDYQWCRRLLMDDILGKADHLEQGNTSWNGLRATGETFWANNAIPAKAQRDLAGRTRKREGSVYEAQSPAVLSNEMREAVGKPPLEFSGTDFVSLDPRQFPQEPFDPLNADPRIHIDPFKRGPAHNPRSVQTPDGVEWDGSRYNSIAVERKPPTAADRRALVRRIEAERPGEPEDVDVIDPYLELARNPPGDTEKTPGQVKLGELGLLSENDDDDETKMQAELSPRPLYEAWATVMDRLDSILVTGTQRLFGMRPLDPVSQTPSHQAMVGVALVCLLGIVTATTIGGASLTVTQTDLQGLLVGLSLFYYSLD